MAQQQPKPGKCTLHSTHKILAIQGACPPCCCCSCCCSLFAEITSRITGTTLMATMPRTTYMAVWTMCFHQHVSTSCPNSSPSAHPQSSPTLSAAGECLCTCGSGWHGMDFTPCACVLCTHQREVFLNERKVTCRAQHALNCMIYACEASTPPLHACSYCG